MECSPTSDDQLGFSTNQPLIQEDVSTFPKASLHISIRKLSLDDKMMELFPQLFLKHCPSFLE